MKQTCKAEIIVAPFKEKVSTTLKLSLTTPVTMECIILVNNGSSRRQQKKNNQKNIKWLRTARQVFFQVYKSSEILKDIIYNPFIATIFTIAAKKLRVWPTLRLNNVFSNQCGISGGCDYADELYVCFISVVFLCFNDWSFILGELVL